MRDTTTEEGDQSLASVPMWRLGALGNGRRIREARCLMAEIMDVGGQHKCAYSQCECQVPPFETYCSDYCSDADDEQEVEVQCDCKHSPCALD